MKKEQKLNEFMNIVSDLGLTEEEKSFKATTLDGVELADLEFKAVMVTLACMSPEDVERLSKDLFLTYKRLTASFIKNNTSEDLNAHIHHHVMMKMADMITDVLGKGME